MDAQTPSTAKTDTQKNVYTLITNRIIDQLDKGTVPWRKPWTGSGAPQNMVSKQFYRGINVMLLAMEGFENNLFITFKQLQGIGGKVKKGEKGLPVIFWSHVDNKEEATENVEEGMEQKKKSILRCYFVFNIAQCENIPEKFHPPTREMKDLPSCDAIVKAMPQCPTIKHKEQSAFYNFKEDFVNMPKKKSFKSDESYYSTLFHELVHSTGHESRLNRNTLMQMAEFGGETYSVEELTAEIGTCFLQSIAGIPGEFYHSAGYIQGWLEKLKGDQRFIFIAAKAAQKAVDFILNAKDVKEASQNDE